MSRGSDEETAPLKDHGSFTITPQRDQDESDHRSDRWQHQAMYVGLHFKGADRDRRKKHHRRHHRRGDKSDDKRRSDQQKLLDGTDDFATPPSARVQFLLGGAAEDEDHQTHDIFCELAELRGTADDQEWKETARWIKFEEDVEEGGERWSKPFVATLALHSLFELRKGIMSGTVMLDLNGDALPKITELVLENMIAAKQIEADQRERVQDILLSKHRHQYTKKEGSSKGLPIIRSLADIGRKASDRKMEGKENTGRLTSNRHSFGNFASFSRKDKEEKKAASSNLLSADNRNQSGVDLPETPSQHKFNEHFAKKIPPGAEASNILVGEVEFLDHPIMAFVRLSKAALLGDLTEVPVPTRFIFILLGPQGQGQRYHEIGRSIATLMSDEVFHDVAYKAKNRSDLLAGIDEFLDQVIVLPPGEWDPNIRIEPPKSVPSQAGRKTAKAEGGKGGLPNGLAPGEDEEGGEEHGDETLVRTGRIFGGLINDIKRKAPWYLSDYKDALSVQMFASFFFMYFACLAPIITFGGLLGAATGNNIAAMESLLSGAICGISYHLFAGQPLTIIGSTGPVLVFETIVYNFCKEYDLNYLGLRFWIGIWVMCILLLVVAFDLSALVRYITRFTEESFAALIAIIFIAEAFKKLFHILDHDPVNLHPDRVLDYTCWCEEPNATAPAGDTTQAGPITTGVPIYWPNITVEGCAQAGGVLVGSGCDTPHYVADVFFLSCLLFIGTFTLCYKLKFFKESPFFPAKIRGIISDFAVMIAIALMVTTDALLGLATPKLVVPHEFKPTRDDRGWVINPFINPLWTIPAALAPAALATILIFMDQQITAVIVNRKENKLKKGGGYHLDLFLISIQIGICSVLGIPWFVAATVLSINHVRSLAVESECSAPGERPKFLGCREQRVTGVLVFLFIGLSVFMTPVLTYIPMPVLYGVFLFMGISSLNGVQFIQRLSCFIIPPKYQPDYVYLRHVPLKRVYLFTIIQAFCLALLWVIKTTKSISILFPLMVLAMCFIRKLLDCVFTQHELKWLDDIMPDTHRREKEEAKQKKEEEEQDKMIEMTGGAVNIPLKDGKMITVPVDHITYDPQKNQVNISEEMSKTAIWKQLVANESHPDIHGSYELRQRGKKKHRRKNGNGHNKKDESDDGEKKPVKFTMGIAEEEEGLLAPEIVVDPPSKSGTPADSSPLSDENKV